jgi:hypothetical protein
MPVGLQFVMYGREIRRRVLWLYRRGSHIRKQRLLNACIVLVGDVRPADPGGFSGFQVIGDGALRDCATAGNLVLRQSEVMETE